MKAKNILLILILLLSPFSDLLAGQWVKKENLGGVARHRATGVSIGQKGYIGLGHVNGTGVNLHFPIGGNLIPQLTLGLKKQTTF